MICAMELLNPEYKFNNEMISKYPIFEKYYLTVNLVRILIYYIRN